MNISLLVGAALLGKGARGLKIAEVGLATLGDDDNFFVKENLEMFRTFYLQVDF